MGIPLYEKIYLNLIERIKDGEFKSGDRVPSEQELSDSFNVSRITSKKALDILAEKRIINRIRGKGSFVSDEIPHSLYSKQDINKVENEEKEVSLIGLITPDFSEVFGLEFVKSVERICSKLNIQLLIKQTYGSIEEETQSINSMVQFGTDGIIIVPVHGQHYSQILLKLVVNNYPVVFADRSLSGIPANSVGIENNLASQKLTQHLILLGHKNIGFISSPLIGTSTLEERLNGFKIAFSYKGLKLNSDYMLTNLMSSLPQSKSSELINQIKKDDIDKIKDYIERNSKLTAFVVSEYEQAVLLYKTLRTLGKNVPKDYSIVCFDSHYNDMADVQFTHIKQDEENIAEKAMDLLLVQLKEKSEPQHGFSDFKLVEGNTTSHI